jgi:hypothetical protein
VFFALLSSGMKAFSQTGTPMMNLSFNENTKTVIMIQLLNVINFIVHIADSKQRFSFLNEYKFIHFVVRLQVVYDKHLPLAHMADTACIANISTDWLFFVVGFFVF